MVGEKYGGSWPVEGLVQGRGKRGRPGVGEGRGVHARGGGAAAEGAEVGKMTAEPSVRHVLSSWEGLCFRSVPSCTLPRWSNLSWPAGGIRIVRLASRKCS
ncbi:hypothetical protein KM043_008180 [Ampulex compressa]|nr:hypothetical protein KM043_008180 [Ampulex compressa]